MVTALILDETWDRALDAARQIHRDLGIHESDGRCMIHRVDGADRHGWRIVVTRCVDNVTVTRFVADGASAIDSSGRSPLGID